ncbi:hypothetical protein V8F33_006609 [Rhypophila sp. PSN 637]
MACSSWTLNECAEKTLTNILGDPSSSITLIAGPAGIGKSTVLPVYLADITRRLQVHPGQRVRVLCAVHTEAAYLQYAEFGRDAFFIKGLAKISTPAATPAVDLADSEVIYATYQSIAIADLEEVSWTKSINIILLDDAHTLTDIQRETCEKLRDFNDTRPTPARIFMTTAYPALVPWDLCPFISWVILPLRNQSILITYYEHWDLIRTMWCIIFSTMRAYLWPPERRRQILIGLGKL